MSKRKSDDSGDEENEFTVEKILDKRRNKDGGLEYLIKVFGSFSQPEGSVLFSGTVSRWRTPPGSLRPTLPARS